MTGSAIRVFCAVSLGTALAVLPVVGWAQSAGPAGSSKKSRPGCTIVAQPDRLQDLTPEGDLLLASGRFAKLAGIRLPDTPPYRDQALAWLRGQAGQPVLVQGKDSRDRWDRVSASIRLSGASPPLDLGHGLVEAGLALVDPGLEQALCQPELLSLEATARERRLGLWADGRYNPIDVNQVDRLQDRIGSFVLVEGRVRSIGEREQRTYLNFGGLWAEDFTIIIPRKTWKLMADRGLGAEALKGRWIRARGILQSWQGTALSVEMPEMIERLEGSRPPR
jgi:endonuclease YncB( thermonuclease family)